MKRLTFKMDRKGPVAGFRMAGRVVIVLGGRESNLTLLGVLGMVSFLVELSILDGLVVMDGDRETVRLRERLDLVGRI